MSEDKFDFGAMVSDQMKTFRPGFKFPGSFNDFKSVESDPDKRRAALKAASEQEGGVDGDAEATKNPLDSSIRAAFEAGDPIEGKVEKEVKGGYEVTVKGQRAFCPFSQIDRFRKPGAVYVGETLLFQVQEYSADDRGVNLVVSRRAELELEQQALKEELRDSLEEGQTLNGQVTKVLPFGAFVNIAPGKDGMIHISKLSDKRVEKVEDVVNIGDRVKAEVIKVMKEGDKTKIDLKLLEILDK